MCGLILRSIVGAAALSACVFPACIAQDTGTRETPLVRAVQLSRRSVVNIHTEKTAPDDKESRFFTPKSRKVTGMGTGVVVDERGYIVTNFHVIQDVETITVTMDGGDTFEGRPVSYDRKHDLAIIRVTSTEPLTVMHIGTSSDLMLAETVYAVGNAFGYEHTITSGIVSALHRDVEVDETQSYENLIQTDASINPGNSGGPLLNLNGEVIGINVAIRREAQRIGFAIPIDDARRTIARLMSVERLNGTPHGLATTDAKSSTAQKLVVDAVASGSAADLCGVKPGDVIRSIRGISILDGTDLERSLLDLPRGKVVDVVLDREGREQTLQFTVGIGRQSGTAVAAVSQQDISQQDVVVAVQEPKTAEIPSLPALPQVQTALPQAAAADPTELIMIRAWDILGLRLEGLSDAERREVSSRSYPGSKKPVQYKGGMRVVSVRQNGAGARFVREGDILLGLDGWETLGAKDLMHILRDSRVRETNAMKCQVYRKGSNPLEGTLALSGNQ